MTDFKSKAELMFGSAYDENNKRICRITVRDENNRQAKIEVLLTHEDLMRAIQGEYRGDVDIVVSNPDAFGTERLTDRITLLIPYSHGKEERISAVVAEFARTYHNLINTGWFVYDSFSSQSSFTVVNNGSGMELEAKFTIAKIIPLKQE